MSKTKNLVIDELNKTEADAFEFTPQAEINRLKKALEEKSRLISDFKRYDEERKIHIRRLEKRIITLRNTNQELNKRINK